MVQRKNRLRATLIYTAILVVTLLVIPALQNDMARLNSWIIILLADFALGAVLLYIPGVWSYEIIIMYILCGRAVLVRSGSPVSDLLWLIIVWALIQPWYYFIARRTIRRCNSKLGRHCWKNKDLSVWEIQKFFMPSYVCISLVIAIFGVAFPMFVGVSRREHYPRSVDRATLRIYPWPTPLPRISSYTRSYFRTSHSTAIYRKLLLSKLFDHHDDSVR